MKRQAMTFAAVLLCAILFLLANTSYTASQEKPKGPDLIAPDKGEDIPDWLARWELARVLSYAKRYDESIAEYRKLLKERPDLSKAKIEMARILFWQGKKPDALAVLESVGPRQTDDESKLLMADLYVIQKSYKKAGPLYREYLEKHPGNQAVRLKLAEMLSWDKQYEASLDEYRKILAALPDDIQVRRKYAFVLIWSGKQSEAAVELRKTLK